MLKKATDYLQHAYGDSIPTPQANINRSKRKNAHPSTTNGHIEPSKIDRRGWEVLLVSDGSTDRTIDMALQFARDMGGKGADGIRVIHLLENRGKGGVVTHGIRHVRRKYAIVADADGARKFQGLGMLVRACQKIEGTPHLLLVTPFFLGTSYHILYIV